MKWRGEGAAMNAEGSEMREKSGLTTANEEREDKKVRASHIQRELGEEGKGVRRRIT